MYLIGCCCVRWQLQYYCLNHICDNLPVIYGAVSDYFESHVIRLSKRPDVFWIEQIQFHVYFSRYFKCDKYFGAYKFLTHNKVNFFFIVSNKSEINYFIQFFPCTTISFWMNFENINWICYSMWNEMLMLMQKVAGIWEKVFK